jgi:hypothetical protein
MIVQCKLDCMVGGGEPAGREKPRLLRHHEELPERTHRHRRAALGQAGDPPAPLHAYIKESAIERMYRDARVQSIGGGATEVMLEEVAKRL